MYVRMYAFIYLENDSIVGRWGGGQRKKERENPK